MQHSRPPQFSLCSSFKKHRSSISSSRFTIEHLTLPKPIAPPTWASLPTPPMSGSPPPDRRPEPPQIAGRRRKRSQTPPPTTTSSAIVTPVTPLDTNAPRPAALSRGGETIAELAVQPGPYALNYPAHPTSYQATSSALSSSIGLSEPRYALSPISPRATRKPKAHVASACVNCKKKHLRCDSSRPCRRCVQSGKEDTCVDVEHKKRGRPPLKPEEPSQPPRYTSASHFDSSSPAVTTPLGGPPGFSDRPSYSQGPGYTPILPSLTWGPRGSQGPPSYYPTAPRVSISPSLATAEGTFIPSAAQYAPRPQAVPGQSHSSYTSQVESVSRMAPYSGYNYPHPQSQPGRYVSNPIFPASQPSNLPSEHLPPLQPSSSYLELPPIRSQPSGPIDPAIVQQSRTGGRGEQESRDDGTQEPGAKRPKMDIKGILGPRNE